MKRIKLRELCFNEQKITFSEGENYIIGPNGSGKTTLFYLIQYIMGLRKTMPRMTKPSIGDNPSLDVSFGNKYIHIIRNLDNDDIIFEADIREKVKVSSQTLGDIYNELLQTNIDKSEDRMAGIEILRVGFFGEIISHPLKDSTNILKKVLGINTVLPIQIKKEIEKFKKEIELEEITNRALQNYIDRVEKVIVNEDIWRLKHEDIKYIIDILNNEFVTMRDDSLQNMFLLEEAKESLYRANSYNEDLFIERVMLIEPYFSRLLSQLDVLHTGNISNVFNSNSLYSLSLGEYTLLKLATLITLCRISKSDWHNGSGLLVNDASLAMLDRNRIERYRKVISEECNSGALQYVEFGYDRKTIPYEAIVLEFNDRGF